MLQAMGQQSNGEGAVPHFSKYYTPLVVLACVLLIIIPASMQECNLKVGHMRFADKHCYFR